MFESLLSHFKHIAGIKPRPLYEYKGSGILTAAFLPKEVAEKIALKTENSEPAEDLHISLIYFGKRETFEDRTIERISQITEDFCKHVPIMSGTIGGFGRFSANPNTGGKDVLYLSIDIPELTEVRHQYKKLLQQSGIAINDYHPFTPHVTLSYLDPNEKNPFNRFIPMSITLNTISFTVGTGNINRQDFNLQPH